MHDLDITFEPETDSDITLEPDAADARLMAFDRSMRTETVDGRLLVEGCNLTKANVCPYLGREIPRAAELGLDPDKIYMLYRDPAEIEAAAHTYERVPLMMQHIASTADSPQKFCIVGTVSNVRFRHPFLVGDLTIWDAEGIRAVESGAQRELSCGYRYSVDMTSGEADGVKYDGVMRGLVCNHIALVDQGRAGPDVFVNDSKFTESDHPRDIAGQFTESGGESGQNKPMKQVPRKYPSYTLADLEKAVAEGRGNPTMVEEIANRKSGASQHKVTPQILGGQVQVKLGRM